MTSPISHISSHCFLQVRLLYTAQKLDLHRATAPILRKVPWLGPFRTRAMTGTKCAQTNQTFPLLALNFTSHNITSYTTSLIGPVFQLVTQANVQMEPPQPSHVIPQQQCQNYELTLQSQNLKQEKYVRITVGCGSIYLRNVLPTIFTEIYTKITFENGIRGVDMKQGNRLCCVYCSTQESVCGNQP